MSKSNRKIWFIWVLPDFFTSLASSPSHANTTSTFSLIFISDLKNHQEEQFKLVLRWLLCCFLYVCFIFETKDPPCNENILFSNLRIILKDITFYKYHINFLCHGQYIFKRFWNKVASEYYGYYSKVELFINLPENNR